MEPQQPETPEPPTSSEELLRRYEQGERDFRGVVLPKAKLRGTVLRDAYFEGSHLEGADLRAVHLEGAYLSDAHLDGAELGEAHLEGANLTGANLEGANLSDAYLEEAILIDARLEGADLRFAHLERAQLINADCTRAEFRDANLEGAYLDSSRFFGAILIGASLKRAVVTETDLSGADLRGSRGLRFDSTLTANTHFDHAPWLGGLDAQGIRDWWCSRPRRNNLDLLFRAPVWRQLRESYTGIWASIHLVVLLVFLAPYIARTVFWRGVNEAQTALVEAQGAVLDKITTVPGQPPIDAAKLGARRKVTRLTPCLRTKCETVPVWRLLINAEAGFWPAAVGPVLLVLYNLLRLYLLVAVDSLRSREDVEGRSPAWNEYRHLFAFHWCFRFLFIVALSRLLIEVPAMLFAPVEIPASGG
jgi:uncharacterized protein YjbI with pentapeptide repeats